MAIQHDRLRSANESQQFELPPPQSGAPLRLPEPLALSADQRHELLERITNSPSTISPADRQALRRECREGRFTAEQNEALRSTIAPRIAGFLGADSYRTRDDASAALFSIGIAARSALESATGSNDPEVSRRASNVLRRSGEEHGANLARRVLYGTGNATENASREASDYDLRDPEADRPNVFADAAQSSFRTALPNQLADALNQRTDFQARARASIILGQRRTEGEQIAYLSDIAREYGNANAADIALRRTKIILAQYCNPGSSLEDRQRLIRDDFRHIPSAVLDTALSLSMPNEASQLRRQIDSGLAQIRNERD